MLISNRTINIIKKTIGNINHAGGDKTEDNGENDLLQKSLVHEPIINH